MIVNSSLCCGNEENLWENQGELVIWVYDGYILGIMCMYVYIYLVGGFSPPLWKNDGVRQIGMMTFPIYGKIKFMFQTTNQFI